MTARPLIGVTTQTLQAIDGIPEGLPHSVVMNQRYYHAAAMAGAAPVLIPLLDELETLRGIYERMDGILIPGGVDVDPTVFGEAPHDRLGRIDPARDRIGKRHSPRHVRNLAPGCITREKAANSSDTVA